EAPRTQAAGVQKAPRHEVAGSLAPAGQRALWGFDFRAGHDGGREAGARRPGWVWRGGLEACNGESRWSHGAYQRAIGSLIGVIVPREIAASVQPAHRSENVATLTDGLAHDVSILLGVGRHLGSQPDANTSITIMRAPQRGHGQGSTRGASGGICDCCCGSAAGGATSRNARAVAMFSARLALAKSP